MNAGHGLARVRGFDDGTDGAFIRYSTEKGTQSPADEGLSGALKNGAGFHSGPRRDRSGSFPLPQWITLSKKIKILYSPRSSDLPRVLARTGAREMVLKKFSKFEGSL